MARKQKASAAPPPAGFQTQTVIQPDPSGGLPAFLSGEAELGIQPSPWQAFVERLRLESLDSPLGFMTGFEGALARSHTQSDIESDFDRQNRTKITPDEANRRYPDLPKAFTEPVYPEIADLIASDNRRRQVLQSWISRGAEQGFGTDLAVGAVAGFADPANLALMAVTGGISGGLGIARSARNIFLENLAINLGTSGLTLPQRIKERQDVSLGQEAVQVVAGAAGGTAFEFAVGAAAKGLRAVFSRAESFVGGMNSKAQERNLRAAVAQHENGARIDVTPGVREAELRLAGATEPGTGGAPYVFRPVDHPSDRSFYVATHADTGAPVKSGEFGEVGLQAVDNSRVANNLASAPESEFTGKLQEIRVPEDAKLLDLEKPVAEKSAAQFVDALERSLGVKLDLPEGATLRDALHQAKQEVQLGDTPKPTSQIAVEVAQGMGFEGYQYVDRTTSAPHNGVVLFDESRAIPGQEFQANKEVTPRMNPEEQQQLSQFDESPARSNLAAEDLDQRVQEFTSQVPANSEIDYLDPVLQAQEQEAKMILKALSEEDPKIQEEVQGLTRQAARDAQELQAAKDYANCLNGSFI